MIKVTLYLRQGLHFGSPSPDYSKYYALPEAMADFLEWKEVSLDRAVTIYCGPISVCFSLQQLTLLFRDRKQLTPTVCRSSMRRKLIQNKPQNRYNHPCFQHHKPLVCEKAIIANSRIPWPVLLTQKRPHSLWIQ